MRIVHHAASLSGGVPGQRGDNYLYPYLLGGAFPDSEGLSNKEIAAQLVISQLTAEGHVEHILTKLGFTSRA